ncbi:hypothetical protein L7F22_031770 [Adiantum nelumboides]|nr:hypothetical protein [Adiantum nelumboides]
MKQDDVHTQLLEAQELKETKSYRWSSVIVPFLFPALGGLLYGYDIGATSSASLSLESSSLSGTSWYDLSSVQIGLVESGSLYGALVGSLLAFTFADFLGRRRELITAAAFYMLGAGLQAGASSFVFLLCGRLVYGLGIGMPTLFFPSPCMIVFVQRLLFCANELWDKLQKNRLVVESAQVREL